MNTQTSTRTIELTPAAADHVEKFLARNEGQGLRLAVKKTGCSGWGYEVNIAREIADDDTVFESRGVRVVVDPEALALVGGTTIDFIREGLNSHFVFRNPNVTDECGCGESFTVG